MIGFTCSTFDLLHAGHLLMLKEAKEQCDYLIVGLQTNPTLDRPAKNEPTESTLERYIRLRACKYVDEIIPYDTEHDLMNILKSVQIDLRILGEEYKDRDFTGKELPIPVYFNKRRHDYSSTELRKRL